MKKSTAKKQPELAEAGLRLQAQLDRIEELEQRIAALRRWSNTAAIQQALNEKREASYQVKLLKEKLEFALANGGLTREERQAVQNKIQTAEEQVRRATAAHLEASQIEEQRCADREAAERELADLRKGCGPDAALEFQRELIEAEERVPELKALVEEQERLIAAANVSVPSAVQLQQRREDILAGLSTGDATEVQLRAIDKEIEALNSQIADASAKASEILSKAEPTLAGLRRKLADAEGQVKKLTLQKPDVARLVLKTQAASVYADYLRLGEELGEKFVKLMSLNALICSVPERRHIDHSILLMASLMKIPRFKVGPDSEAPSMSTVFSAAEQRIDLAREVEKARLKAEGFTLLD